DARGIDEVVEPAGGAGELRPLRLIGKVGDEDIAPERGDVLETTPIDIGRKDANPFTKQPFSHRPADATRGAGHDGSSLTRRHRLPHPRAHPRISDPGRLMTASNGPDRQTILKRYRDAQALLSAENGRRLCQRARLEFTRASATPGVCCRLVRPLAPAAESEPAAKGIAQPRRGKASRCNGRIGHLRSRPR